MIAVLALAGLAIGSFIGVVARRIGRGADWAFAPSACEHCSRRLGPAELIPLVSYLAQRGRCRGCGLRIAPAHLAVEIAGLSVPLWAAFTVPDAALLWTCGLGWGLLALAAIDGESLLLPRPLCLALGAAGLAATADLSPESVGTHAFGALLGFAVLWSVAAGYRALRGRDGLGGGDAWLLGAGASWTGPAALPGIIGIAAVAGLVAALFLRRTRAGDAIPFGPFLALGIWLAWLYGPLAVS